MALITKILYLVLVLNLELQAVFGEGHCNPDKNSKTTVNCVGFKQFPLNINGSDQIQILNFVSGQNQMRNLTSGDLNFTKLAKIETLIMQNCSIQNIEQGAFVGRNQLSFLDLGGNLLKGNNFIVFHPLWDLKDLRLRNNPIGVLPGNSEFPRMKLRSLDLAQCKLSTIPVNLFKNLKSLERLDLQGNELTTLDWKVFIPLRKLSSVSLSRNKWKCDCNVGFILDYFKQNLATISYLNYTYCEQVSAYPNISFDLQQNTWQELNSSWLTCPSKISSLTDLSTRNNGTIEELSLKCNFSGVPQPEVEWLLNGKTFLAYQQTFNSTQMKTEIKEVQKVHKNKEYNHLYSEYKQDLIIKRPPHVILEFSCRVSNIAGNDNKLIILNNSPRKPVEFTSFARSEESGPLLFGFSLWLVTTFCAVVALLIVVPVLVVVIYFKRKERRKRMLLRVLSAGVIREIQNDRESFEGSVKSYPVFSPLAQIESELESGYSESDEDHEMELRIQRKSIPTNSTKTTTL